MSTTFGEIKCRDGTVIDVEKYGNTHTIRLERQDGVEVLAFDDPDEVAGLIKALELAAEDIWEGYASGGRWVFR